MLPLRDDVRRRLRPYAVLSIVALNLVVFGYELQLSLRDGPAAIGAFIEQWGLVPREFLREIREPGATQQIAWLTPITAMFVHGGWLHLGGNLLYLWLFGGAVEEVLGHRRFPLFYLACGLAGAAAQLAAAPDSFAAMIGASGAVSGLLGAYLVAYPRGRLQLAWPRVRLPAWLFLGAWLALQVLSGLHADAARVAWWAHVGGFCAGLVLGRSMWVRAPSAVGRRP